MNIFSMFIGHLNFIFWELYVHFKNQILHCGVWNFIDSNFYLFLYSRYYSTIRCICSKYILLVHLIAIHKFCNFMKSHLSIFGAISWVIGDPLRKSLQALIVSNDSSISCLVSVLTFMFSIYLEVICIQCKKWESSFALHHVNR